MCTHSRGHNIIMKRARILALGLTLLFQHGFAVLDDTFDIAKREGEMGDVTDIEEEIENYVNGNESVYQNQFLFNFRQTNEKRRFW